MEQEKDDSVFDTWRLNLRIRVVGNVFIGLLLSLAFAAAVPALLSQEYWPYMHITTPFGLVLGSIFSAFAAKPLDLKNIKFFARKYTGKNSDTIVSVMYLDYLRKKYIWFGVISLLTVVFFETVLFMFNLEPSFGYVSLVPLISALLLFVRKGFISYRVMNGVFGSNETEAKELINFIRLHSNFAIFLDEDGHYKKLFLPENIIASDQEFPEGQEVSA